MTTERDSAAKHVKERRRVAVAIAVLVLLVAVAIVVARRRADPLSKLQSRTARLVEGRIAGFGYAPFIARRGEADQEWQVVAATAELGIAMRRNRSVENLHRFALARLALGTPALALQLLEEASARSPKDANVLSDLAAVQLAAGSPADAAESAARALDLDASSVSAAFNWALALQSLSNRDAAIKAWGRYRALDESTPWADEAKERLTRLKAPRRTWDDDRKLLMASTDPEVLRRIARSYPQRVRAWIVDELLPRYVESRRAEDLTLLEAIAKARAAKADSFLSDLAADARTCKTDFANGARAYRDARVANRQRDMTLAGSKLDESARLLDRAGSPFALLASIYAASNRSYRGQTGDATARLDAIDSPLQRYPSLAAEALWVRGLIHARAGEHSDALRSFRTARSLAIRGGETENVVALTALVASELDEVAEPDEADRYRIEALHWVDEIGSTSQRMYVAMSETATVELQRHRPHVALAFIDTQQSLAEAAHDPLLLAESATARALALRDIGRFDEAVSSLAAARRYASDVAIDMLRSRTLAELDYIEALVRKEREPDRALVSLTSAMQRWQTNGWRFHAAAARLSLGDIRLERGDRRGAEGDYRAGIAEMEETRGALDETKLRVAYFERADRLFERLVELLIHEKRIGEALSIAERKRGRALLDVVEHVVGARPLDAASIRAAIPAEAALLEFELLPDGAIIWLVDSDGVTATQTVARGEVIASAVGRHRQAIERNDATAVRREGRWLYQQLIAPFARRLAGRKSLIVVPDRELFALPYASLIDDRGQFLVETYAITIAPSASLYVRTAAVTGSTKPATVLAVAQPAPRDYAVLRHAESETAELARVYDGVAIYVGTALQPRDFLRRAASAGVVSFAGHSSASALVFESRGDEPAALLTIADVTASRFPSRPLVVLAACKTGRGSIRAVEGVDSLATAFLGAGARSVVATLWDVDDESSERLFVALHRGIHTGMLASAALRQAQLAMLHSTSQKDREPASWSGVFVTGSI